MRQNKWVWIEHPDHILLPVKMVALHGQEIEAHSAEGEVYSLQNGADYPEVQVYFLQHCWCFLVFVDRKGFPTWAEFVHHSVLWSM
jgi:hypothetical protein